MAERHEFALFFEHASGIYATKKIDSFFVLKDSTLCHRIQRVLRSDVEDVLVLFDQKVHVRVCITAITQQGITVQIVEKQINIIYQPYVVLYLPLLKREALEDAVYAAVELAASEIQLMTTHKMHSSLERINISRLQTIIIGAAEQSKNFAFPSLFPPKPLRMCIDDSIARDMQACVFDQHAQKSFALYVHDMQGEKQQKIAFFIGPEGDFSKQEKEMLQQASFPAFRLTPTVLRSQQAVVAALTLIRSYS